MVGMFGLCNKGEAMDGWRKTVVKNMRKTNYTCWPRKCKKGLRVRGETFWLRHFVKES